MNYLKSFIFGLILSMIGGGILYVAKDKYDWLEFDSKYVFAIFLIGYLIQTLLGIFGMEDWYCFTGLCNQQVNDVTINSSVKDLTDTDELIDLDEIDMDEIDMDKIDMDKINMDVSSSTNNMIDIQNTMEIIEGNENRYEFIPSSSFTGAMKGYVFKTGNQGLGYYIDQ
tara:strand:- start:462 stop:968 length:507 start_codon:yes stop_codon:yes gene_type:complete